MKKVYVVPFLKHFDVTNHTIKAESKEVIWENRRKLQEVFKGDGVVAPTNMYRFNWELGEAEPFEYEL